jgi:hypothetical protein
MKEHNVKMDIKYIRLLVCGLDSGGSASTLSMEINIRYP